MPQQTSHPQSPGDYATYRGAWRGPLQFELSLNGARDGDAHAMASMVIELRPDGEVVGQASESGCRFSGLATQNVAPYMASMDVSLEGMHRQEIQHSLQRQSGGGRLRQGSQAAFGGASDGASGATHGQGSASLRRRRFEALRTHGPSSS